ncbi:MAG: alpha/beta fold hydrolase [Planctomycetes bacterium]|nr:alpha/beta fold hydrolase [Planctomycetota bacterium]
MSPAPRESAKPHLNALLLPGLDGSGALFGPLVSALAKLGVSARAVGYPVKECLSYDALTLRVLADLPPAPFVIVGESFSGAIALAIARSAPRGLCGVVLAAAFVRRPVPRALGLVSRILFSLPAPAFGLRIVLAGGDAPPALVKSLQAVLAAVPARVLAHRLDLILGLDARADLSACPVPVLYLAGDRDRLVVPGTGARLQRLRPDLELETLPAPHLLLQRQPQLAAERIAAFARAHVRASSSAPAG